MLRSLRSLLGLGKVVKGRPYPEPPPRTFDEWLVVLGLTCESGRPTTAKPLTFDEFTSYPGVRLLKTHEGELYGYWRIYGDVWGEVRTVREWLEDLRYELVNPADEDWKDMNLVLGYDEFRDWSHGKVTAM